MSLNRARIGANLYNKLNKQGLLKEVIIKRSSKNAYKEKGSDLYVCTVKGYYHRDESRVESQATQAATINKLYNDKILFICDDDSKKIQEGDFFKLNNQTYKIIDLGNIEDIIFDMYLTRM